MGCSGSKSTGTENGQRPPANNGGESDQQNATSSEEVYVTVEQAAEYIVNELGLTQEQANKVVERINKNDDGKVSNQELIDLWEKIKQIKNYLKGKFQEIDKDDSGSVTPEEAVQILSKEMPGVSEESLKAMVNRFDTGGNGKMDYNEFVYFYAHCSAMKENMKRQFDQLDKDGNGTLEADELEEALTSAAGLKDYMAKSLVEDFDVNKDKKINKEEFNALWVKIFDSSQAPPGEQASEPAEKSQQAEEA